MTKHFMFSTGIENSCPTIQDGRKRVDQMAASKHYAYWREDFDLVEDLGVRALRFGPPLYNTYLGPDRFDWEFADMTFGDLGTRDIIPIADLCHFGVPDWIGNFQNPDFPKLFSRYAKAFAERFRWVQLYTPINEMFVCATFSAYYGWWNEQLRSDKAFVTALKNIVKANVLAMHEIVSVRPDAIFVQSESSEYFHPENPRALDSANHWNERRFLTFDLNYGHEVNSEMYQFLLDNGLTREEYDFFLRKQLTSHCIMGNDYYISNEHNITAEGVTSCSGELFGYDEITRQYYQRYRLPIMHTETNATEGPRGDEATHWLRKQWANVLCVRNGGVPTIGFTWYSLIDQVDWDTALREDNGNIHPVGLYDLDRKPRAVGKAYKRLIDDWQEVLPAQSICLTVPLAPRFKGAIGRVQ
jgi:beta-glucosidase/6-phospho-beta-glucosidase/beta-galactosidase